MKLRLGEELCYVVSMEDDDTIQNRDKNKDDLTEVLNTLDGSTIKF